MAKVSFTFDDGLDNARTQAAPTLAAHGFAATSYITTGCIGMTTVPNTCPADPDVRYMSWSQVSELRDTYGWDIGGHGVDHSQLATDSLTDAQLAAEVAGGRQALVDHGFNPVNFASPYGDYDNRVLAAIAKSYGSHRGFWDLADNTWPYEPHVINNMQVQAGVPVGDVLARIDQAVANKHWLVLTFHGIEPTPSSNPEDYQYSAADLATIAAYAKTKQNANLLKVVTVADSLITSDTNLLTNGSFANGLAGGWTTDSPGGIVADGGNHGSYPEPAKAVSITASAGGNSHLFSPRVAVQSSKTYLLQNFLHITARTGGELGYYIDEYDANGGWISGRWVSGRTAVAVRNESFTYTPSSAQVVTARLQVYVTPGSGIQAYVDNFWWFPLEVAAPPPPNNNLLVNGDFNGGIAQGWSANNPAVFTADSGSHGSPENPENAIRLASGVSHASLFAPLIDVNPTTAYDIEAYVNVQTITSPEVAFYVDEYDANGTWISGQYKTAKRGAGIENISFVYQPTSGAVKKAGLQVIVVGASGITGYLDNVKFLSPV